MNYLVSQIAFCLVLAAAVGFLFGWLLRGLASRQMEKRLRAECDDRIRYLESEID